MITDRGGETELPLLARRDPSSRIGELTAALFGDVLIITEIAAHVYAVDKTFDLHVWKGVFLEPLILERGSGQLLTSVMKSDRVGWY